MSCNENNNKSQPLQSNKQSNKQTSNKQSKQANSKQQAKQQRKMSANNTYATLIKEIMAKMPDDLEDKKDIDLYYKNAKKEVKEKMKEDKNAAKAAPTKRVKRVKKVEVDSDGNEIVKVKKPLTKYLQFIQDNRQKVKDDNPNLSSKEYMVLLANLWNKYKEDIKTDDDVEEETEDDDKKDNDSDDKEDDADVNDDDVDDKDDKKDSDKAKVDVKKDKKGKKDKV